MSFERRRGLRGFWSAGNRSTARRGLISLAVGGAALGVGYLVAATVVFSSPDRASGSLVRVPDLGGESMADARQEAEEKGLAFRVAGEIFHPDEPAGRVIAQLPLPGQFVESGVEIEVTLSLGPEQITVPDVTGLSESQATLVLGRLGIATRVSTTGSHHRKGSVIGTTPAAGNRLSVPSEVELLVSEGRDVVAVPDLEGRHLDDVDVLLSRLGLVLGSVTFEPEAVGAPGRVIGQAPPAGFDLREGGEVAVRVAGRPSEVIRATPGGTSN